MKNREIKVAISICCFIGLSFFFGCAKDLQDGFKETYDTIVVIPQVIASNLNFPWGVEFIDNVDPDGIANGSILGKGNLLIANRGTSGEWANTITHINPHTGNIEVYSHTGLTDAAGIPAVDIPHGVAFQGPFVCIANDAGGLGTVSVTDPNPSKDPNGHTGQAGEPVPGPAGSGVFMTEDFGFMVLSVTPEDQSVGVFHHTTIAVEFSAPVDPNTVTADTFKVQVDYSPISPDPKDPVGSFEFSQDYKRVEFIYQEDLAEGTRYKILLDKDILDEDGVKLDGNLDSPGPDDFSSIFVVGSGSPMVIWIRPETGAEYVANDTVIQIGFSEQVRASSVSLSAFVLRDSDGDKVAGDIHVDTSLTVATLVPRELLKDNTVYSVEVNYRVKDLSGLPLDQIPGGLPDAFTSYFSTGAGSSNPPKVLSASINGDVLSIVFSNEIDPESRTGNYLSVLDSSQAAVPGTIVWPINTELNFTATNGFFEGTYRVCVEESLTDMQGVNLDGDADGSPGGRYCVSLVTGGDRLYVTSSYPEDGDVAVGVNSLVFMNFSKPVNQTSVTTNSVFLASITSPEIPVDAILTLNPGNTSVTLDPQVTLAENADYLLTVTTDVTDMAGNSLDQEPGLPLDSFSIGFRTGGEDNIPPCIFETVPSDGDENIPVGTSITVRFTEPVVASSVNSGSFYMTGPAGAVAGNYQFQQANGTVIFQPINELR